MGQGFINLAVKGVERSMQLYAPLGFGNNPAFSGDQGKCMGWSDTIFGMLQSLE